MLEHDALEPARKSCWPSGGYSTVEGAHPEFAFTGELINSLGFEAQPDQFLFYAKTPSIEYASIAWGVEWRDAEFLLAETQYVWQVGSYEKLGYRHVGREYQFYGRFFYESEQVVKNRWIGLYQRDLKQVP